MGEERAGPLPAPLAVLDGSDHLSVGAERDEQVIELEFTEDLDDRTRTLERLQLQLRTRDGVPREALSAADVDDMSELVQPQIGRAHV